MFDPTQAAIAGLRDDVQALTQGLMLMNETLGALTEMVSTVLGVLQPDDADAENPTAAVLSQLTQAVNRTGLQVGQMREAMTGAMLRGAVLPTPPN